MGTLTVLVHRRPQRLPPVVPHWQIASGSERGRHIVGSGPFAIARHNRPTTMSTCRGPRVPPDTVRMRTCVFLGRYSLRYEADQLGPPSVHVIREAPKAFVQ